MIRWPILVFSALLLGAPVFADETLDHDPKFTAVAQRFQADFGLVLKPARTDDASSPSPVRFYKDNTKWQGFAEPYGMNIATDDRATLYARLMTAHVAGEGRGDQVFLDKLKTDKVLKAKADRLIEFFQLLKSNLAISSRSPLYSTLEGTLLPR